MTVYAIDFDDTIHDRRNIKQGYRMGIPMPGALTALRRLKANNNIIIIFTARATSREGIKAVADWMDYFGLPYDDITAVKTKEMDLFIDNRAMHYDSWPQVMARLSRIDLKEYVDDPHES